MRRRKMRKTRKTRKTRRMTETMKSREGLMVEEESRRGEAVTVVPEQRGIIMRITETNRRRKKRLKST